MSKLAFVVPNYEWWEAPFYGVGLNKYQRSFEGGVVTPFFEGLVATLLAKLRSVDELTQEE